MSIQGGLETVLGEFGRARLEPFGGHPIAGLIRDRLAAAIAAVVDDDRRYKCQGGPGMGNWNSCPWIAVFDRTITVSAQSGMYPVYLFREDMTGVYLSLNQAMTEAKARYKADAKTSLRARAANVQAFLGSSLSPFGTGPIDLRSSASSSSSTFYEAGNICSVFYERGAVPDDAALAADLTQMLDVYGRASGLEGMAPVPDDPTGGGTSQPGYEDGTRRRMHERIERNDRLSRDAKEVHGYRCQACGFDFVDAYGELGRHYIEAHHLIPLSTLKGRRVALDPAKDFAVLCSNCHRMIHRSEYFGDVNRFREAHVRRRLGGDARS